MKENHNFHDHEHDFHYHHHHHKMDPKQHANHVFRRKAVAFVIATSWTFGSIYFSKHNIDIFEYLSKMSEFGGVIAAEKVFRWGLSEPEEF